MKTVSWIPIVRFMPIGASRLNLEATKILRYAVMELHLTTIFHNNDFWAVVTVT